MKKHLSTKSSGYTLLEVMVAMTILMITLGTLLGMSIGVSDTNSLAEAQLKMNQDARAAVQAIASELRNAQWQSIANTLPAETLSYRVASDVDGNGTATDRSGRIETSALRTIRRDGMDTNADGQTTNQLVIAQGNTVLRVLTNNLCPTSESTSDTNGNGIIDKGFWVTGGSSGLTITVQTEATLRNGRKLEAVYTEFVKPRN